MARLGNTPASILRTKITGTTIGTKHAQDVNLIGASGLGSLLEGISYDYIAATYPTATSEVYTYKSGGAGGTTVATITVVYTSATKELISSVART